MKRNILLPTDFSDNAFNALLYALKLYEKEFCTFYFLNVTYVLSSTTRTYITTKFVDELQHESLRKLNELKQQTEIANDNANHNFEIISSEENLKFAIPKAVKAYEITSIVMGTKGASNAVDIFMGSNTVDVLKKVKNCPILVVPDALEFVPPRALLFPTDFNRPYKNKELEAITALANLFHATLKILHINVEKELSATQELHKKMLSDYFENLPHSFHWEADYTKKSTTISTFIEENKIDLLAMVNYKHSLLESILKEPVIKKIAFHPTVPVLIIPE
tara:strand:+ start:33155 stop:33988 length:834 start_codon:yes stop_codon:yes gene_type:complete